MPISGLVELVELLELEGLNAQLPSRPPPKHASLLIYNEHYYFLIQLTPLDTHFTPLIAFKQEALVVNITSVHYFSLHVEVD